MNMEVIDSSHFNYPVQGLVPFFRRDLRNVSEVLKRSILDLSGIRQFTRGYPV